MTNGEIDRLGERIGASTDVSSDDLNRLQEYRQTFQGPISHVFNFVLNAARKIDKSCIVTYRIKRIDTIVEKLHRYYNNPYGKMKLSRMWDIAGCRCIIHSPNNERLFKLLDVITNEYGEDCKVNEYIDQSRSSGYRSIHVYVKDKQTQKPIEIQIRNIEQHNWATLVEIVDLLYGTKNKENGADSRLGRFLFLYSRASDLSEDEFTEMLKIERGMKVFERMSKVLSGNYVNIRKQWLKQKQVGSYYVISANKRGSEIVSFPSFEEAETEYYRLYHENSDSNIVLTHLRMPDFEQISMAYSNYILAMHAFFDDYRILVSQRITQSLREGAYFKFFKFFEIYNSNVKSHFENLAIEVQGISACSADSTIPRNQVNKWEREVRSRIELWRNETIAFFRSLNRETKGRLILKWLVNSRVKSLRKAILAGQKSYA